MVRDARAGEASSPRRQLPHEPTSSAPHPAGCCRARHQTGCRSCWAGSGRCRHRPCRRPAGHRHPCHPVRRYRPCRLIRRLSSSCFDCRPKRLETLRLGQTGASHRAPRSAAFDCKASGVRPPYVAGRLRGRTTRWMALRIRGGGVNVPGARFGQAARSRTARCTSATASSRSSPVARAARSSSAMTWPTSLPALCARSISIS